MFGALAEGRSRAEGFLESEDCLATFHAFEQLGIQASYEKGRGVIEIEGKGLRGLAPLSEDVEIDLGNSGTSIRLLMGILAGQRFEVTLTGDASLCSRPMKRVTEPLKKMGAQIKGRDNGNFAPLRIRGGRLHGIEYINQLGSAQVKSAILLAALYAESPTRIQEVMDSRDHTERMLSVMGARLRREGNWLTMETTEKLHPFDIRVPGDISSGAFFLTAAAMLPGSSLEMRGVGLNPTRTGILDVLNRMGARIDIEITENTPEPVGTVRVEGTRLAGTRIAGDEIPRLIDELPVLMVAMALAEGESLISGAAELRVKETDRIHSMVANLTALGAEIEELPDGCLIRGRERLQGGRVPSFKDHRTAMSMAVASLAADGEIEIEDTACIATSFPTFFEDFHRLYRSANGV